MSIVYSKYPHTFHIPVMGTGFTIDTPLNVARYGISSVISLVDDVLVEQMRRYHSLKNGVEYNAITDDDDDPRAHRINAYLALLDNLVRGQVEQLRHSAFEPDSEITRYYEMLPESWLKSLYRAMLAAADPEEKKRMQMELRERIVPGSIDVNIMTKLDCLRELHGIRPPAEFSDAKAALRGFALSEGGSSIVCSAGMNRELYKYFAAFDAFYPDVNRELRKKIVLKVSDYRSAEFQGKFLAKYGLWVSEFRIESGLNCGGHAFATKGFLLGPILEEFSSKRQEMIANLHELYSAALRKAERPVPEEPLECRLTVQGGIGTASENNTLLTAYSIDGTGWGTPFLLVPEVVNVDPEHLEKLACAGEDDVYLSQSSPMGVPFWNLRSSASERARERRISEGRPGSVCKKGYIRFNTEVTDTPICTASSLYQQKRLAALENENLSPEDYREKRESILAKSCICHDLAGGATRGLGIDPQATTAICPGPNIVNFSKIVSLREMIDHIYGRISLIDNPKRPNMFASEMKLYIDNFRAEVEKCSVETAECTVAYLTEFKVNLLEGTTYYMNRAEKIVGEHREQFIRDIQNLRDELNSIAFAPAI